MNYTILIQKKKQKQNQNRIIIILKWNVRLQGKWENKKIYQ